MTLEQETGVSAVKILGERSVSLTPEEYSSLSGFTANLDASISKVHVFKPNVHNFGKPATGRIKQLDDCPIAY